LKILHFIYDHTGNPWLGGGGAVRAYELNRRLSGKHDITIVSGQYPSARDYQEGNLKFHFVGTTSNNYVLSTFAYAWQASRFLRAQQDNVDIVVEDFAPYNPIFSKFIANSPAVIQVHHREGLNLLKRYFLLGIPFLLIENFYPKVFRHAIAVAEASKKKFGLHKAAVISNGIDEALLESNPVDNNYIAFLGRIQIHNKGLDSLIKALTLSKGKLVLVGRGRDEEKLKTLAAKAGISERIDFMGHLGEEAKIQFLSGASFLVLPSRYEGQGIVVLEAAACGKPVVVSDIPELRFAVEAGFGMSFKTGDAVDLAEKINLITKDSVLREKMGKDARQYAENFTWDLMAEKYEKFLYTIFNGKE
jgi:glycosyltransferase involved in cell wall biosynthesis